MNATMTAESNVSLLDRPEPAPVQAAAARAAAAALWNIRYTEPTAAREEGIRFQLQGIRMVEPDASEVLAVESAQPDAPQGSRAMAARNRALAATVAGIAEIFAIGRRTEGSEQRDAEIERDADLARELDAPDARPRTLVAEAEAFVIESWGDIERIGVELLDRRELTADDIRAIIGG